MLDSVDPSARDGNTNYMLIVAFAKTLFKLLVNNCFHAGIDFNISVFLVDQLDSLLNVDVDALVDQSLSVGVLLANVKSIA